MLIATRLDIIIMIDGMCELSKKSNSLEETVRLCEFNNNPFYWKLSRAEHETRGWRGAWRDGEVGHYI